MSDIRVRFAPSPTGDLHIGGVRTAYFNWLFARNRGGTFILRIEDTDLKRSTDEAVDVILEGMEWLGLDWDEGPGKKADHGPYFQSQRLELYQQYAEKLLEDGQAYPCFCTAEELKERREKSDGYDGRCRKLTEGEIAELEAEGRTPTLRFKLRRHEQEIVINDIVRKEVTFSRDQLDDFILFKSDGTPTYNFAVVVDDTQMEITHVIRGEDHLSNTPKQVLLYEALGWKLPEFAHIPMILGPDRSKLSKRHGATAVTEFKEEGFLPEAVCNYLALLGWSLNESQQIFSREEAVKKFRLEDVSPSPAVFDRDKLEWLNGKYIRKADEERIIELGLDHLKRKGYLSADPDPEQEKWASEVIACLRTRIRYVAEITGLGDFFFEDVEEYTEKAREVLDEDYVAEALARLIDLFSELDPFEREEIEDGMRDLADLLDLSAGELIHPTRAALTGKTVSPGIFTVVELLGREKCIDRLEQALEYGK